MYSYRSIIISRNLRPLIELVGRRGVRFSCLSRALPRARAILYAAITSPNHGRRESKWDYDGLRRGGRETWTVPPPVLHFADVRVLGMAVSMAASSRAKLSHSFHVASRQNQSG